MRGIWNYQRASTPRFASSGWLTLPLLLALGCPRAAAPPTPSAKGNLRGVIHLTGAPPAPAPLDRHSDPYCEQTPALDGAVQVGAAGGLANVFVTLEGELPAQPPPQTPVRLEQRGCTYFPRVFGMVEGQPLEVQNLDGTLHNVHIFRGTQTLLNRAQKIGSEPVGREIPGPPAMLEVKCDVHPWMVARGFVSAHPWFAVSDASGRFEIRGAPAGRRRIEAVHEKFGRIEAEVEIPAGGDANVSLDFRATGESSPAPSPDSPRR